MTRPVGGADVVLTRPNGKPYRPKSPPTALMIEDEGSGGDLVVLVMFTHDVSAAEPLARAEAARDGLDWADADGPTLGWWRKTIRNHEGWLEPDDVRGAATVEWRWT